MSDRRTATTTFMEAMDSCQRDASGWPVSVARLDLNSLRGTLETANKAREAAELRAEAAESKLRDIREWMLTGALEASLFDELHEIINSAPKSPRNEWDQP